MKFYFAPMEGITGYIYRRAHHDLFPGMDAYFMPFISANYTFNLKSREKTDTLPANNAGIVSVPQILANKADEFLWAANYLRQQGYRKINFNLGCPARMIVSRKKGSGLLEDLDELDELLKAIFDGLPADMDLSVKTRLGIRDFSIIPHLMEIYNRYPISLLIIHPRTQRDLYTGRADWDAFEQALSLTRHKVCYNGDITSPSVFRAFTERFPQIDEVMIGRGLIANPALVRQLKGGAALSGKEVLAFTDRLMHDYEGNPPGERILVNRMKEVLSYMVLSFDDPSGYYVKNIRKAQTAAQLRAAVTMLVNNCEVR